MADKKISQLSGATTPLTGTEELAIVQGGVTVKATAQDVADLGGGGGFSFSSLLNPTKGTIDIVNAVEGTSIPDGSTATYTKTVPLPFTAPTAVFGCFLYDSIKTSALNNSHLAFSHNYGITNSGLDGGSYSLIPGNADSPVRFVAFQDYTQTFRAQDYTTVGSSFSEVDETNTPLVSGSQVLKSPTYTQLNNNMFGLYNGPFSIGTGRGIGISSSNTSQPQEHSVVKAIYISGNNLVFNFKKIIATSGETWTRLQLNVYNFS